jgi:hypothetical protein
MEYGIAAGVIGLLGVVAVYFWIVRRSQRETQQ